MKRSLGSVGAVTGTILLLMTLAIGQHDFTAPEPNSYVLDLAGEVCLLADLAADLEITYPTTNGDQETAIIPVPPLTPEFVNGNCAEQNGTTAMIELEFNQTTLALTFTNNNGSVYLAGLAVSYQAEGPFFPNSSLSGKQEETKTGVLEAMGGDTMYFMCPSTISYQVSSNITVHFYSMKVQAFNVLNGTFADDASICDFPNTTTPEPTTTTSEPTTTTSAPNTTTSAPNTTTSAPNTTTSAPTTTHLPPTTSVTPTALPTLPPTPPVGNWTVQGEDGTVCIVAKMGLRFIIPYTMQNKSNGTAMIDLEPSAGSAGSVCGGGAANTTDTLQLHFKHNWTLAMTFGKVADADSNDKAADQWELENVTLTYYMAPQIFPDAETNATVQMTSSATDVKRFKASLGGSYLCISQSELDMSSNVSLHTYDLHIQAFKPGNSTGFVGNVMECVDDLVTNSVVPIAVGATLAALVVIVVIAYIVGRKRSRTGYESV